MVALLNWQSWWQWISIMKVFIAFSCLAYAAASGLRGEFNATQPVSRRNVVPKGWYVLCCLFSSQTIIVSIAQKRIKGGRADRFETVEFKVALKQRNLKWLNEVRSTLKKWVKLQSGREQPSHRSHVVATHRNSRLCRTLLTVATSNFSKSMKFLTR